MMEIKALFFDQDGVIVDTERDGHRVAFNQAFKEFGLDFEWDDDTYHGLLQVGGGKERMRHYLTNRAQGMNLSDDEVEDLVMRMHRRKTELFISLVESGNLPLRPGVHRLMQQAKQAGLIVGVCTTSNERAAQAITQGLLSDIRFDFVLAGDVVKHKKPDPEIYLMAIKKTGLKPEQCVVVEDSHIGTVAAKTAGCHVIATVSAYTAEEDLSNADIVVSSLGDEQEAMNVISAGRNYAWTNFLTLRDINFFFNPIDTI